MSLTALSESVFLDLRYSVRVLRKNPSFSLAAILLLALGMGANTATFGILRAVLLTPLPHPESGNLVMVEEVWPSGPGMTSWLNFVDLRQQVHSFDELVAVRVRNVNVQKAANSRRVVALEVTVNFFQALKTSPLKGRYFIAGDDVPGAARVAVLSEQLWRQSYGSDSAIIGQSISVDGEPYVVVGVSPASFRPDPFPSTQVFVPTEPVGQVYSSGAVAFWAFGRLKKGTSLKAANNELAVAIQTVRAASPNRANSIGRIARAVSMHQWESTDLTHKLPMLWIATTMLLLIVYMNLANFFLAWMNSRRREWATRLALGASRWRIVCQVLTLSFVVAIAGSAAGIILAEVGFHSLRQILIYFLPYGTTLRLDTSLFIYILFLSLATGVIFSIGPTLIALRAGNLDLHGSDHSPGISRRQRALGRFLVSAQIALSMVLVCCAGLMFRTLYNLQNQELGFLANNIIEFQTAVNKTDFRNNQVGEAYYLPLLENLRALPGVTSVGVTNALPINMNPSSDHIQAAGHFIPSATRFALRGVMPGYFQTLGIAMLRGRGFTEDDRVGSLPVAVINDVAARLVLGDEDPLGQQIGWGTTVIGVYKSTIQGLRSDVRLPEIDLCIMQMVPGSLIYDAWATQPVTIVLRTTVPVSALQKGIDQTIHQLNPRQGDTTIRTLAEDVNRSIAGERFTLRLIAGSGFLALILAALGIYGLMSYLIVGRTSEIGVRMALGASQAAIRRLVLREAIVVMASGIILGSLGALSAGTFLHSTLFRVKFYDPVTLVSVLFVIAVVSLLAAVVPAQRAATMNPVIALRHE